MNTKFFLILVLVITSNSIFSQQSLNDYKYVIVPKNYDFLKSEDQYQLNSLTRFLFKKEGFKTLFDTDNKSQELANNPCLSLISKVKSNSGLFSTKLVIELVNCKNEVIHTSNEGNSKQKDYKKAYQEALRKAFQSISSLGYKYTPVKVPVSVKKEETIIDEKPAVIVKEVIPVKVETEEESVEVIKEATLAEEAKATVFEDVPFAIVLYAQANPLGFQLVDSSPKVVYVLLKSSKEDIYFLKNKNGIVFKENKQWFVEYYNGIILVKEELQIKF
ncbi:MAG: hypothetical protein L3J20_02630 [Flavobacteriaceae bacterium]|nr:hypothetical protein [Flavobacteriaceae bacterium]